MPMNIHTYKAQTFSHIDKYTHTHIRVCFFACMDLCEHTMHMAGSQTVD